MGCCPCAWPWPSAAAEEKRSSSDGGAQRDRHKTCSLYTGLVCATCCCLQNICAASRGGGGGGGGSPGGVAFLPGAAPPPLSQTGLHVPTCSPSTIGGGDRKSCQPIACSLPPGWCVARRLSSMATEVFQGSMSWTAGSGLVGGPALCRESRDQPGSQWWAPCPSLPHLLSLAQPS